MDFFAQTPGPYISSLLAVARCCHHMVVQLAVGVWSLLFGRWCWVTTVVWAFSIWVVARCYQHAVHKTKQGLNSLRDLISCHGFGHTLSAAPTACLKSEECSYLFFLLVWPLRCLGKKNRNLEFISQQRNKFSKFFFLLSTSTVLTSKNIFIIYNFIAWFCFFPMLNILRERLMLIVKEIDHYTEPYPWT